MPAAGRGQPDEEQSSGADDNARLGAVMLVLLLLGLALVVAIILVIVFLV